MEVPAARAAADRRTASDVEKLSSILEAHLSAPTVEDVIRYDAQFHCAIAVATGNMLFVRLLEDLQETLKEQTLAVSTLRNRGVGAAHEHRLILDAISDRDGDAAAVAMEEHLDAVERAIRRIPSDITGQRDASGEREPVRRSPSPRRHRAQKQAR